MTTRSSMSRSLYMNRDLEKLEPYEGKLSCTVLRGEEGSNALDLPDRPSDLQQRDGRAIRKGNEIAKLYADNKVDIIIYAVEKSLDSYKFNLLHNKQLFITQLKSGAMGARTIDEGTMDEKSGMNFSEYMAILSGNTDLLDKAKLEKKVVALESERKAFNKNKSNSVWKLQEETRTLDHNKEILARMTSDWNAFNERAKVDADGNKLNPIRLDGVTSFDVKAIGAKLQSINDTVNTKGEYKVIGELYGFQLLVKTEDSMKEGFDFQQNRFFVGGEYKYSYNNGNIAVDPKLASMNFLNALERIPRYMEQYKVANEKLEQDIPVLLEVVGGVWKKEEELKSLKSDLATLERKIQISLSPQKEEQVANEQSDNISQEQIIGRIKYLGSGGDVGEVLEFDDKEKYLEAIKKELDYNPDGFRANTISKDPELRKNVDDLYYDECGVDNPKTIEHYIKAVAIETGTQKSEAPTQPISISNGHSHPIEPSVTTAYVRGEATQTNGRSNVSGESAGQTNTHSLTDGQPSAGDKVLIVAIPPPKEVQTKPKFRI